MWPSKMAEALNAYLPPDFFCTVNIHVAESISPDIATFESLDEDSDDSESRYGSALGQQATILLLDTDADEFHAYEALIYNTLREKRLVAAIELISPANKDRVRSREAFVTKCEAMLRSGVCVVLIDPVTVRMANMYAEIAAAVEARRPAIADATTYAVCLRSRVRDRRWRIDSYEHLLAVGAALPTLPVWIGETQAVPLDLEATYEAACKGLRIP